MELIARPKGRPNGIALSPSGRILYVANTDVALATFTVTGACVAAALSRLRTRASWVISIGTILSSFLLIQTPQMNRLLHLQALHRDDWVLVGLAGLIVGCSPFLRDLFGSRIKPTTA